MMLDRTNLVSLSSSYNYAIVHIDTILFIIDSHKICSFSFIGIRNNIFQYDLYFIDMCPRRTNHKHKR